MVNLFGLVVKTASLRPLPASLDVDPRQLLLSVETKGRAAGKWIMMMSCYLMSSDVIRHIRDKL